jgi:hypothetical protein
VQADALQLAQQCRTLIDHVEQRGLRPRSSPLTD